MTDSKQYPAVTPLLVAVEAVSLNYRDIRILDNKLGPGYGVPFVPGTDIAGTVLEVGANVRRVRAGDRVISNDIAGWVDGPAFSLVTNSATIAGRLARRGARSGYRCFDDRPNREQV